MCVTCVGVSSQKGQFLDSKQQLFRLGVVGQQELCPGGVAAQTVEPHHTSEDPQQPLTPNPKLLTSSP